MARGFARETQHLAGLIKEGILHQGFSLIDILQPCVSFNRVNTYKWYADRVYKVDADSRYDEEDRFSAFQKAQEWGEKIPIGIIYRNRRKTLEQQIPAISDQPLVAQKIDSNAIARLLDDFR